MCVLSHRVQRPVKKKKITSKMSHTVRKCTLLCSAVVHSHHSLSPFSAFTGAIHSLRAFVHGAGDFEGCITLSGRFRWLSEVSGCDLFSLMSLPAPPTVHQHVDSRVALTTLPAARGVSRGVQRVGKGAVLELRLQLCIYKHCTHKLLRDIFKKVLISVFPPSIDDTRVENVRRRLAFQESRTCLLEERSHRTTCRREVVRWRH